MNHRQKYTKALLAAELRIKLKNSRSEIPHPSTFHSEKSKILVKKEKVEDTWMSDTHKLNKSKRFMLTNVKKKDLN